MRSPEGGCSWCGAPIAREVCSLAYSLVIRRLRCLKAEPPSVISPRNKTQPFKPSFARGEDGFTLVELTVVALILIVLLSIAIPTFLSLRSSGRNRAAQSNLNTALQAAERLYIPNASYSNVTAVTLHHAEPSLTFVQAGACGSQVCNSSGPSDVVVWSTPYGNDQAVEFAAWSSSGTCWFMLSLQDSWQSDPMGSYTNPAPSTAGTYYGKLTMSSSKGCNIVNDNVGVNGGGWANSFSAAKG